MTKITIFTGKTCPKCPAAKAVVEEVAKEIGCEIEVLDIEENMIMALQNQIASVPAIMIDDEVVSIGEVPSREALLQAIKKA
ncbi:MAG: thioredoxin family protein [Candidatus Aenigmatarchaeota archaeon]|nr:thioredoxin family protein [Candidatus Aenigmarchaeota archaeon]